MPYVLAIAVIALLVFAAIGHAWARWLLLVLVGVPLLLFGAWQLWLMEGIGWWALAALVLGIPAAIADARTRAKANK